MFTAEKIKNYVDNHSDDALNCLVKALQSPSPTGYEKPMADTMYAMLQELDIPIAVHEYAPERPNYIAEWCGSKPGKRFLFNGHMDVFPPSEGDSGISGGPWSGKIIEGNVYGRGASDMKGGVCASYMAVKFLKEMGFDPKGSIVLNYVVDEENSSEYGVVSLLRDKLLTADYGISPEPSDNRVKLGHGAIYCFQIVVHGDGGHAGFPIDPKAEGNYGNQDAIEKSILALQALYGLRKRILAKPTNEFGQSIMSITMINAGDASNTYARKAVITVDRRPLPNESKEEMEAEIIQALEDVKKIDPTFSYEYIPEYQPTMPVYNVPEDSFMVQTIDTAYEELFGEKPEHFRKCGGTDASFICDATDIDMPWFGPGYHDSGMATESECISIENYLNCIKTYMLTLVKAMS